MANVSPFEILAQPFVAYYGAVGATFPAVDADPTAPTWTKIGTSGDLNYSTDGVTVIHSQAVEIFRPLGDGGPRKIFRTEEDLIVRFVLADLTLEQYRLALNNNAVTTDAPADGLKKIGLTRGLNLTPMALLVRGLTASPYGNFPAQYEVPICVNVAATEVNHRRTSPAMLSLDFQALVDFNAASEDERFGRLVARFEAVT